MLRHAVRRAAATARALRAPAHPAAAPLAPARWVVELGDERAKVKMELISEGNICAVGEGLFVAVKEGHPAYHRWN